MTVNHPLIEMAQQLEKAFQAIEGHVIDESHHLEAEDNDANHTWHPSVVLDENDEGYIVRVETRGLDLNRVEIHIDVENNVLILSDGPFRPNDDAELSGNPDGMSMVEDEANMGDNDMNYGSCTYEVSFPDGVDTEEVLTQFEGDVLEVRLPHLTEKMAEA